MRKILLLILLSIFFISCKEVSENLLSDTKNQYSGNGSVVGNGGGDVALEF